jgi:PAS domain-containing protein
MRKRTTSLEISPSTRLSAPSPEEATARILKALLVGLLAWTALQGSLGILFFVGRRPPFALLLALQIVLWGIALLVLRRGNLRLASWIYLLGVSVPATVIIVLNGGITSPVLVLYVSIPISAAWLLGFRAALISSALCVLAALAMAVAAQLGIQVPHYFPGTPLGDWSQFLQSTIIAALPVMVVMRTLNESLLAARRSIEELRDTQEALRRERDLVNRVMETSPVGIVAVNRDGKIDFINSSAERIFGLSREEVTRRVYNDPSWQVTSHDGHPYPVDEYPFTQVRRHGGA